MAQPGHFGYICTSPLVPHADHHRPSQASARCTARFTRSGGGASSRAASLRATACRPRASCRRPCRFRGPPCGRLRPADCRGLSRRSPRIGHVRVASSCRSGMRWSGRPQPALGGPRRHPALDLRRNGCAAPWRERRRRPASSTCRAPGPDYDLFPFAVWGRLVRRHLRRMSPLAVPLRPRRRRARAAARNDGVLPAPLEGGSVPPPSRWSS